MPRLKTAATVAGVLVTTVVGSPAIAAAAPPSVGTVVSPSGVGALKMNMPMSQAMTLLGTPSAQDNQPMVPQFSATYKSMGVELISGSQTGQLTFLVLTGKQFTLPGGVHVGSPAKKAGAVLSRHGFEYCTASPTADDGCYDRNTATGTQRQVIFENGKVASIEIVSLPAAS